MKLGYSLITIEQAIETENTISAEGVVDNVLYDSRKIYQPDNTLFFCLQSNRRDGHDFILDAYKKGVRNFVVASSFKGNLPLDCVFFRVKNTLQALQKLAQFHRSHFSYPVIGITGSTGKTTVKEWLYQLLQNDFRIIRSPKSYNSQLGVALSLLEMSNQYDLAIIEAGVSQPNEMEYLEEMIQPTIGILTNIGTAHRENFQSPEEIFTEKIKLFKNSKVNFLGRNSRQFKEYLSIPNYFTSVNWDKSKLHPWTATYIDNLELTSSVATFLTQKEISIEQLNQLPQLAMRMEVFEGINQNTIINDAYNLDLDALKQSLEFLVASNYRAKTAVMIVASEIQPVYKQAIEEIIRSFPVEEYLFVSDSEQVNIANYSNYTILIKGYRNSAGQRLAQRFKLQKHETSVEVDMDALRNNLAYFRSKIQPSTKILVMVKASAYGTGAEKIAAFLERNNVDYLGVAYGDEGVALRRQGITIPIVVMNAEPYSYEEIIQYQLEPAIFSIKSLEEFTKTLINLGVENYPIHLKIDTGMHRLGINEKDVKQVVEFIKAQPEITLKGVYSHLADADNFESDTYSKQQFAIFERITSSLKEAFNQPFLVHLLNTEGILRFPEYQHDMVRMGIGLYGYVANPEVKKYLEPAIRWKSIISQIRELPAGERISYNGRFETTKTTRIATIPVGYADGLKRLYSKNGGEVCINNQRCPIVGTICMDMCMVDVTDVLCQEGDEVEIIGTTITMEEVSEKMQTISYEVLTSISKRVHRVYLNE